MLGLQQTGPGFRPHRQPSRCGQSPALPNRLGFLLEKMSGRLPCDVRELAARARWANRSQGGQHDRSL